MIIGIIGAVLGGAGQPAFVLYLNTLYDSFTPLTPIEEILSKTADLAMIYMGIGLFLWVFHFIFTACFGIVSDSVGRKFRTEYLWSVLHQEVAWFDVQDIQALPGEVSKQCFAI